MKTIFVAWFLISCIVICGRAEVHSLINSVLFQDKILQPGNLISFYFIIKINVNLTQSSMKKNSFQISYFQDMFWTIGDPFYRMQQSKLEKSICLISKN